MDERPGLSGRRAQAAINDQRIAEAARAVVLADPDAPMAAIAARAGVGIGALYRRYRSKEDLLQQLTLQGLRAYNDHVEQTLEGEGEPWADFAAFVRDALGVGGGSLARKLAGRYAVTPELQAEGIRAMTLTQRVLDRAQAAGVLRHDLEPADLTMIAEMLQNVTLGGPADRDDELRLRYLAVMLDGLRAPAREPLPHPAPSFDELRRRHDPA